jgi:hypothetical protein
MGAEWGDWPIYERTQKTRSVEVTAARDELVKDAWDETVIDVPAQDGTPAKVNTVTVIIDGVTVEDGTSFGHSFTKVYPLGDKYVAHNWTVTVTAWDDSKYSFTESGTSEPCSPPVILPACTTVTGSQTFSGPEYVGDALTLVTTEQEQGYWQAPFSGTLADIGTQLAVSADPASEVGLWIWVDDLNAWIVYEEGQYGGDLWSKTAITGIPAGHGYAAAAQIEKYIALYGNSPAEAWLLYGTSEAGSTAVSSVTVGCTTYTFKYVPDVIEVTPAAPVWIDPCGADNGYWSYENGEGYSFNALPTGELVLTADEGYAFPEGTVTWWQKSDSGEECPPTIIEGEADEPTFHDQCGVDGDVLGVPVDLEFYTYEVDDQRVKGVGTVTVTVVPVEGYAFPEEAVTEWTFDFTNDACPLPPTTPKQELAQTGLNPDEWLIWGGIGALAILAGLVFTINHLRHRREQ